MRKLSLVLLLITTTALAAPKKPSREAEESEREQIFVIPVPQPEIRLAPVVFVPPPPVQVEISASTWEPEELYRPSYNGKQMRVRKAGMPALSLNSVRGIWNFNNGIGIGAKLGVSYLPLERRGPAGTQKLSALMGRLGVEFEWDNRLHVVPLLSLCAMPTWISAEQSVYEQRFGGFGVPYEAGLGVVLRGSVFSVGAMGTTTWGTVSGSSVKGTGVSGLLRVTL